MDLAKNSLNPNKRLKEEFVSNLTGSSMFEIAALSAIVPALVVLRQWSSSRSVVLCYGARELAYKNRHSEGYFTISNIYSKKVEKKDGVVSSHKDGWNCTIALVTDFLTVIVPVIFLFTVFDEWVFLCMAFLILILLLVISTKWLSSKQEARHISSLRSTLLSYRVSVVLITCVCILAVDFKIYPRRYAKTETYGTGLMDLGVGSFVVANSLVSRQARGCTSMGWKSALQSIGPLIFLGFARLISIRGVDYQVHVGEYGVHWNFFFTLASVSVVTSVVNIHPKYCGVFGLIILIGYQTCLLWGLNEYLVSNERTLNIISQNKEGIFSVFGYWGMYMVGVYLGNFVFFGHDSSANAKSTVLQARIKVWAICFMFWLLAVILDNHVERVSRRMCNLAYVCLVIAQNFQVLSIIMLSEFVGGHKPLVLEEAFNQNLLGSFLLANLLTGMINMSMDTLSASSFAALGILLGYSFLLSCIVGLAWFYGINFKFLVIRLLSYMTSFRV